MAQYGTGTFRRSTVTKMLIAEVSRTTHAMPKGEEQYESQTYLSPTGKTVAKVMIAGVVTEKEDIGKDESLWRIRVADPSGAIGVMAGKYQPEPAQMIAGLDVPCHVIVVGKLNIYEPEAGDRIVSIRPDSVTVVDGKARDDVVLDASVCTARAIKAYTADKAVQTALDGAYGVNRHKDDAFMLIAQQAIESLLPDTPAEAPNKRDEPAQRCNDKAGEDKKQPQAAEDKKTNQPAKKETKKKPAEPPITKPAERSSPSSSSSPSAKPSPSSQPKGKAGKEIDDSIKTIQEVVLEILAEKREVKYDAMPDLLKEKGVNPNMMDWESAVKRSMNEGRCFEPKLGVLRVS